MRIDWLEIDGRRVRGDAVERVTEYKCDGCGEFVAEPVALQMQFFWTYRTAGLPPYHLHPACVVKHMPFMITDLAKQGIEL